MNGSGGSSRSSSNNRKYRKRHDQDLQNAIATAREGEAEGETYAKKMQTNLAI